MLTPKKLALAHTLGPVVVDIAGTVLTEHEIRRLEHPMTGAVILFTRNFTSAEMLRRHSCRAPRDSDHRGSRGRSGAAFPRRVH